MYRLPLDQEIVGPINSHRLTIYKGKDVLSCLLAISLNSLVITVLL